MFLLILAACEGGGGGTGSIDTSDLWEVEDGRFQVYRHLTADEYAAGDVMAELDESNLLSTQYTTGGCDSGDGWRIELRSGGAWDSATVEGALHVSGGKGLSICGWESTSGTVQAYDPPVELFTPGTPLKDGGDVTSGDWTVTASRVENLSTYFGTFPLAVQFDLSGTGSLDGWSLTLAKGAGIVLYATPDFTADLVYTR